MFLFQTQKQQKHEADNAQTASRIFVETFLRIDASSYARIENEKGQQFSFDYTISDPKEKQAFSRMRELLLSTEGFKETVHKALFKPNQSEKGAQLIKKEDFEKFLSGVSSLIAYKIIQKGKELGGASVDFHGEVISICSESLCDTIDVLKEIKEVGNNFRGSGLDLKSRIEGKLAGGSDGGEKEYDEHFGTGAYGSLRDHLSKKLQDIWMASTGQSGVGYVLAENISDYGSTRSMLEYNRTMKTRDDYQERLDSTDKDIKEKKKKDDKLA